MKSLTSETHKNAMPQHNMLFSRAQNSWFCCYCCTAGALNRFVSERLSVRALIRLHIHTLSHLILKWLNATHKVKWNRNNNRVEKKRIHTHIHIHYYYYYHYYMHINIYKSMNAPNGICWLFELIWTWINLRWVAKTMHMYGCLCARDFQFK